MRLIRVERTHLNLMFERRVRVFVEEHFVNGHVECRYNLLRIRDELSTERRVKLLQVFAVEVQERLADQVYLKPKSRR